ncbi:acetyl-coenzyme-A carboxylase [Lobulomyces angularis]|nr:acetyl-coenzyme-A carboxylase [Lobulomyces angularis]
MVENLLQNFISSHNGTTLIRKVLVANNGMAAVKCIRSIRRWAYEALGNEREIQFTAMATPEDIKVNAEYIRMADQYVEVPGGTSNNNYSNVDLIVDIAERMGVHAVYVGWGFASENPVLAEKLQALPTKPVFIGPPPNAMRSLGDKIASTIVAQSANVPCISWSGDGLTCENRDEFGHVFVPEELFRKATTVDVEEGIAHAERIGYPVMIKASEGGGGKGIRLVNDKLSFRQSFEQVQREIPGSPIFIMKVAKNSRHLEVQLLADFYGNAIALFGRDCSVQRRHQKIIEEAPVTVASEEIIHEMEAAAVRLAKLVGYVSAGTVEYLYSPETKEYFFLELNPRLQVEHPTTEMVSGVDIPAAQLQIAMGIPLNCINDIRQLYGLQPNRTTDIDFDFQNKESLLIQRKPRPRGHVIATRITAENPDAGFKPNSGMVQELNFRSSSNVWGYFSVDASGGVHEYADSQFGHIFSYGETRDAARKNLVVALKELSIRGDFRTTIEYLIKLLEHQTFIKNAVTTAWLDKLITIKLESTKPDSMLAVISGAVYKAFSWFEQNNAECLHQLEKGQTPQKQLLIPNKTIEFIYDNFQYKIKISFTSFESLIFNLNGKQNLVNLKKMSDGGLLVLVGGKTHSVYSLEESHVHILSVDGKTCIFEKDNDPTKLRSPSPGKLVRYLVEDKSHVNSGEAFAEIEVMKMYMPLLATESGIIMLAKPAGSVLQTGDIIGSLVLDDPQKVKMATQFADTFPDLGPAVLIGEKLHQKYKHLKIQVDSILEGFDYHGHASLLVRSLIDILKKPELPFLEVSQCLSSLAGRIPAKLEQELLKILNEKNGEAFPSKELQEAINKILENLNFEEQSNLVATLAPVEHLIEEFAFGIKNFETKILVNVLERYHAVQILFNQRRYEDVILELRDSLKSEMNLKEVISIARAYVNSEIRAELVLSILDQVRSSSVSGADEDSSPYLSVVEKLATLNNSNSAKVSLKAREFLLFFQMPNYQERYEETFRVLNSAVRRPNDSANEESPVFDYDNVIRLITANYAILDVLPAFFYHENVGIRAIALYTYVLHTSQAYSINRIKHLFTFKPVIFEWEFVLRPIFQNTSVSGTNYNESGGVLKKKSGFSSFTDLSSLKYNESQRKGLMCAFESLDELKDRFNDVFQVVGQQDALSPLVNILSVAVKMDSKDWLSDDTRAQNFFYKLIQKSSLQLRLYKYKRVTFMLVRENQFPRYFTFQEQVDYNEDQVIRHIEPLMAYQLELQRLQDFEIKPIFVDNRRIHMYHSVGKKNPSDVRFFIRALVYPGQVVSQVLKPSEFLVSEGNRILSDVLDNLEVVWSEYPNTDCNHLFINFIPTFELDLKAIENCLKEMVDKHGKRLWKLRITNAEVRFIMRHSGSQSAKPIRFMISSSTGYVTRVEIYQEVRDSFGVNKLVSISSPPGQLHKQPVNIKYLTKESIQPKRYKAHLMGTTYVYDFPELFRRNLEKKWVLYEEETMMRPPNIILEKTELSLNKDGELTPIFREPGLNNCGMVCWILKMFTPSFPEGREIMVIANDVTFNIGSFGTDEDLVFNKASEYARKKGIPRIYISANSGARIGLAEEVKNKFKIKFLDNDHPEKGVDFLYISQEDYKRLNLDEGELKKSCVCEKIILEKEGEIVYKIEAIIGKVHGIGVENLQGSGMIAGETSRAYDDIFTLTLVTCRSVGIGAYLVRLGQRTIQVEYTPIILTGANALNKVLGREVYSSNLQLGGTQIMYKNGVSHLVAENDMEGVSKILNWLSYVPKNVGTPLPVRPTSDSVERDVDALIPEGPYNPRNLLAGYHEESTNEWTPGFFDRGSFTETLGGWAKGVVVGRGRLGGIPMGVIAVETRTTETIVAADPANEQSTEQVNPEAGQVWYPNSAFKTAQAINDFNKGEQLPLIIFANWRGFSGGQNDMYKEVLKYGAQIVDALVDYKQPVFVYIIGELRGGAWVVLDPKINPEMMEMYAESNARGGVLEPEGLVEIKFRKPQLLATMERLDETYRNLKVKLRDPNVTPEEKLKLENSIKQREKTLLPVYHNAAIQFADLHDRPKRMVAKGAINRIVNWSESRKFFYTRLLRRISEEEIFKEITKADPTLNREKQKLMMSSWFFEDIRHQRVPSSVYENLSSPSSPTLISPLSTNGMTTPVQEQIDGALEEYTKSDTEVVRWLSEMRLNVDLRITQLKNLNLQKNVKSLILENPSSALEGVISAIKLLGNKEKREFLDSLNFKF